MVDVLYEPRFISSRDDEFLRLWILFRFYQVLRDFLRLPSAGEFFDPRPTDSILPTAAFSLQILAKK
jgi:hypothetical protein